MTGPGTGAPDRGTEAPARTTRERDAVGAILVVLALGLALRVIIAYLVPGSGFRVDLEAFESWATNLAAEGPFGFYSRPFFHDYTPGYLYVLWLFGLIGTRLGEAGVMAVGPWTSVELLKLPAVLADLALGWLAWSMARELGARPKAALLAGLLVVFNPVTWFDSVVWGQVDSFGAVFLLLAVRELWRDRPERAAILAVVAAIIKPQLGILVPLVAAVTIRRALEPHGAWGDEREPRRLRSDFDWERRERGSLRIWTTALAGLGAAIALSMPFGLSLTGLVQQVFVAAGGYPYLSVNAYNPWALVTHEGNGIAANALWVCDTVSRSVDAFQIRLGPILIWDQPAVTGPCSSAVMFGPLSALAVGTILLLTAILAVTIRVAARPDRRTILVGLTVLALAFFVLPTRVHERYLFPFFPIAAILAAVSWPWRFAYVVASAATLANLYVVLTSLYPDNPGVRDWFGIGPLIRSPAGVTAVALAHLAVFLFAASELRTRALARLRGELAGSARAPTEAPAAVSPPLATRSLVNDPDPPVRADEGLRTARASEVLRAASETDDALRPALEPPRRMLLPEPREVARPERSTVIESGYLGWIRSRLLDRPIRPDRSRALAREPRGRLDRLDVWLILVLLGTALVSRVWRLAEPYQMHFDEVYHPRTATEFLQHWRYGLSHDIYEWTHPHLAKYVMAGGLVLFGDDRVSATSELGVPVRSAALEPRWDEAATASARAGDRIYVATGDDVRAYDLSSRALVAKAAVPGASAVAVDATRHRILIGTTDGSILAADTGPLDELRHGRLAEDAANALAPVLVIRVDARVRDLFAARDGTVAVAVLDGDEVVTFDPDNTREVGRVQVPGTTQLASGGSGSVIAIRPDAIADQAAAARLLADLTGGQATEIQTRLQSGAEAVYLGRVPTGDARTRLDQAVNDGRLAGVEVRQVSRIAVAGEEGVTFIDSATGERVSTLGLDGPALGLALVTGVDSDRLYVAVAGRDGPLAVVVPVAGDSARDGPTRGAQMQLPGQGGWVAYDEASQMVHVVGTAPDGAGRTIYVIEPHGNAVYADAPLSFDPIGLLMDANQRYPSVDRQQIVAFAAEGTVASIEVGSHAFAWRLPGAIAGAILAVLIYLLARILFQRRTVAILAGVLVLADGMLFAQSRIGMNDSYVGMLIMAAYLLFAAVWVGPRPSWRGFWLAMPVIGLLLGLALAAKWVAAYSIGALGILVLTRSALGRLVLIAGMVVATTVLGYMAITVPVGVEGGNLLFVAMMIGLTAIAVVVTVVHPIAWSWEEQRLAVGAPAVVGAGVVLGALALGSASLPTVLGPVTFTPMELGFALLLLAGLVQAAFVLAGGRGLGPLAAPAPPGDPRSWLEPAAPAAAGWLRPGALLGLPIAWLVTCLLVLPVIVYVAAYVPWAFVENHRMWPGWPAGHTGQLLLDLTEQMYRYHNTLTAAHPASSPWWAWPFDLKPVWFYQESFAGGTAASIYDAGNLVSWWLSIPALAFVAWQAFRRRSLALALIAIGFACQWIAWARIDRAAFQYHYYTSLPFVLVALAYFLAELWHGASRRTWLLARLAAATAVIAPMAMWLLHRPLCGLVRVEDVYPNSLSCPTLIPDFLLTARALAIAIVVGIGVLLVIRQFLALDRPAEEPAADRGWMRAMLPLLATAGVTMVAQVLVSRFVPETPLVVLTSVSVEPIALVALLPLSGLAAVVATSRDARRFVAGAVVASAAWFLLVYPNIAALPLPQTMVNAYQGLLPTYVYTFQFPVSTIDRNIAGPDLVSAGALTLLAAVAVTCIVVAYSAWSWRLALAEGGAPRLRLPLGRGGGGPQGQA